MVTETPLQGREFKVRFQEKYENWLEQEDSKTKKEDDRVETVSELPKYEMIKKDERYEIYGFENEIKSLENFLLDQKVYKEFKTLVVVGEYGVGKTALCQTIFNKDEVKSVYAPRIWVSIHSKETEKGEDEKISVLKRILQGLGAEDLMFDTIKEEAVQEFSTNREASNNDGETAKDKELSALLYALHLNLRWKKYLIVFDDVREEDKWNEILQDDVKKLKEDGKWGKYLSDGFPKGSGGRVIYTTREETLARKLVAEEHEIHRLWPLSDHQSVWNIYEAVVTDKDKDPPRNDKKCIDDLMNKSRGLPLAAILMAKLDPVFLDDEGGPNDPTNETTENSQQDPPLTNE